MNTDPKNPLQRGLENIQYPLSSFIRAQTTTSWFLLLATFVAVWWANSEFHVYYQNLKHTTIGVFFGDFRLQSSLRHFINDGLMAIFFFLLGLEIKREVLAGELNRPENRRMLVFCAIGGMVFPAAIYSALNWSLVSQAGWGIPLATDTAFALGVLTIVRKYIPGSLLAFIVGLAIIDDVGAILVIALFYTQELSIIYLVGAMLLIALLVLGNYAGLRQPYFYMVFGIATWWMLLNSGVHATLAGVAVALTVPARPKVKSEKQLVRAKTIINSMQQKQQPVDVLGNRDDHEQILEVRDTAERASTPLRRWEDALELPVALLILPLFVLTNAGVTFSMDSFMDSLGTPAGLGIIAGLVLGKSLGISGACWLVLRFGVGRLPNGVNFQQIVGVSMIAGIGFTMSTFIATLGFDGYPELLENAKASILVASLISAMLGMLYLRFIAGKMPASPKGWWQARTGAGD